MAAALCPCCGQPIVPAGLALPPTKQRILDTVRRRPGVTAEELREIVWADDPAGGPEDRKVLYVHVHQLNRLIAPLGVAVRGGTGGYRVTPLNQRVPQSGRPCPALALSG